MSSEFDLRALGHEIQRIRHVKGLSLQDVADRTGLERQSISRYENAKTNPSVRILWQIAVALDTNLSEIVQVLDHKPATTEDS
ncbi:helix-turn-helix domain-containing protein [Mycobacteroides abscessus]|uniref:helix-turn-helix domain-containing protein n=1 Tax=Mycobacteroides abscessus TaxID=36809 RepID=UPI000C25BB54|nr:helix-turn-helix transcriptional regulator [Mycobacteroides abscessus]